MQFYIKGKRSLNPTTYKITYVNISESISNIFSIIWELSDVSYCILSKTRSDAISCTQCPRLKHIYVFKETLYCVSELQIFLKC